MIQTQERAELLRIEQVVAVLQLGRSTIYRAINAGRLKPIKVGKAVRITRAELERFVRSLQEEADEAG